MPVTKVIELVGSSDTGWEDAVKAAVQEAAKTVKNITSVSVRNLTAEVADGSVKNFRADVRLSFTVEETMREHHHH